MGLFPKSLLTAAVALGGLAQGLEDDATISSVADEVVVDEGGSYLRTTTLGDGSLLGGYAATDGDDKILKVVKSTDGGQSWEQVGTVDTAPSDKWDMDNAFPLALPDGKVLYAFRKHERIDKENYASYYLTVCISEDDGANWDFHSNIDVRDAASDVNGLWEPFLRIAEDGAIQAYYSAENSSTDQDNLMRSSTDGGLTWGSTTTVSGEGVTSRDGMVGVASANDGKLICVFENTETGPFSIDYVLSDDDGKSWNSRGHVYTAPDNLSAGAPQVINVGGTLVASFMASTDEVDGAAVDDGEMKVVTSKDNGATWSEPKVVSGVGSHWPGLYNLDDNRFLALYSNDDTGLVTREYEV